MSSPSDTDRRLDFQRRLLAVTTKIHATDNLDQIMLDLGLDFCDLFASDRFTLYTVTPEGDHIVSKVKTGLTSLRDLRLPIGPSSVAGFVAQTRQTVNIADVYDEAELKRLSPDLKFQRGVDQRTGYRTHQMLVAPLLSQAAHQADKLLGVVQFINHRGGCPFPELYVDGVRQLCVTLAVALTQRLAPRRLRGKYDALATDGLLSGAELEQAMRSARERDTDIETVLLDDFGIKAQAIGAALSQWFHVPYEPYRPGRVKPIDLLRNLKAQFVEQNGWLPLEDGPDRLVVMALDPERVAASRIVAQVFPRARAQLRVTTRRELAQTVQDFFGTGPASAGSVGELLSSLDDGDPDDEDAPAEVSEAVENELVKLLNKVIMDAHRQGASDIHIEPRPGREKTLVRFRKDGALVPYIEIPASYRNALVARVKIMCDLDISERRRPQDGKIRFKKYGPLDIELRVATIPSSGGVEDIVMRILQAGEPIPLDQLGVLPHNLARLKSAIEKPYGLFFVCGPTGSGKTTTLHSILAHLNTSETKIWTAEDPVEITQKGLRQVQVNRKAGLDFASVMRAFLRADPDIIMVGEMRDRETVGTGVEASLTGHLVLSTLHTNSAPESVVRLLDMGMDPFNFADALLGILAQRLARRLCTACRQPYHPDEDELQALLAEYCEELPDADTARAGILEGWRARHADEDGRFTLYRAVGCAECNKGYRGRVGLHELMLGTAPVKRLLTEHARVAALLAQALDDGMLTLKMDGIEKVLMGITDIKMVRAVCVK